MRNPGSWPTCAGLTPSLHDIQYTELPEDRDLVYFLAASPTQAQLGHIASLTPDHQSTAGVTIKQVAICLERELVTLSYS